MDAHSSHMYGDPVDLIRNRRVIAASERIMPQICYNLPFKEPLLDVGAGGSRNRAKLKVLSHNFFQSEIDLDVEEYPSEWNNRMGTVVSTEVIEHLYNPLFHLQQVHKVLRDDGDLLMTTPNDYSLIYKAEHLLNRKYRPHFHQFSERDLRDLLGRAGFKIVKLKKFHRSGTGTLARISRNGIFVHAVKS
jgi:SAM-dependent methyltransferase